MLKAQNLRAAHIYVQFRTVKINRKTVETVEIVETVGTVETVEINRKV